ncbi:hypothetical protein GUITHDRAFT_138473 [Guillardia theta CCMP2712]|uniref:AMP-dependent synthetase/ligase domain-containing protein n=1 Tax=Guillardia theta (strain CCMP2712) TaxID=905079 RepID=L1JD02_GUITC|nr:hypothetical protein GUITHDRAFT_138473 [Guillardia theta CCMP2712]EKX45980.1 hypothetical protein GUITHDRAFT_138473 [Guillardia theta CCMP2712]|eukprot:XP_005832960.1 hypothetical protein GUITHDRAFT_138473 [Guillardia theta CCMP2712]
MLGAWREGGRRWMSMKGLMQRHVLIVYDLDPDVHVPLLFDVLHAHRPLLISDLFDYAVKIHHSQEIVSRTIEDPHKFHRYTYSDWGKRTKRMANSLKELGVTSGDRVATIAWNGYRHFELYYAISGGGAILHTINPRLSAEQMSFIINHAEDKVIFVDLTFFKALQAILPKLSTVKAIVVMSDKKHVACLDYLQYEFVWLAMDGKSIAELLCAERVSCTAGVPTVWSMLFNYLESTGTRVPDLKRVLVGGAACPPSMIATWEKKFKARPRVRCQHAWGMTELSPTGVINDLPKLDDNEYPISQTSDKLPRDGKTAGRLKIRGNWVLESYYKSDKPAVDEDGWFDSGDVATISEDGYMQITDRNKDLIKSGGEWISSIELEHAAAIAVTHPVWGERPLIVAVAKENCKVDKQEVFKLFESLPKWSRPDDVAFVDHLPVGGTGKVLKVKLREMFDDHYAKLHNATK